VAHHARIEQMRRQREQERKRAREMFIDGPLQATKDHRSRAAQDAEKIVPIEYR